MQCEELVVQSDDEIFNEKAEEFLGNLESSVLDLVVNDVSTQVRHDNLPTDYEHLKTVLLSQEQKMAGLKSGGKHA